MSGISTYYVCEHKGSKGKWLFYSFCYSLRIAIEDHRFKQFTGAFRIIKFCESGAWVIREWDRQEKRIV